MQKQEEQDLLLDIVETWIPKYGAEYRGFRCANCQEYRNQAYYHWLRSDVYILPVHMCAETCEKTLKNGKIKIDPSKRKRIARKSFGQKHQYPLSALNRFREIISAWPEYQKPNLRPFTCDDCEKELLIDPTDGVRKGYHVWWKMDNGKTLAELHFHKECGDRLGVNKND